MLAAAALSILGALLSEPTRHSYHALRHGQSLANVEGIISSNPDVATREHGLSELGQQQAAAAAADVAAAVTAENCRGVAIYTSDFKRAAETAETVHAALRADGVAVWPADGPRREVLLRERWFGEFDGGADSEYATVWAEDARDAGHTRYGVESVESVLARGDELVARIDASAEHEGRWLVLLVAHGDVLQILQSGFAGRDPREHRSLAHLPTATLRAL